MKIYSLFILFLSSLILSGCSSAPKLANLQVDKSHDYDVESIFGSPDIRSYKNDMEIWRYSFIKEDRANVLDKKQVNNLTRLVLEIRFNQKIYKGFGVMVEKAENQVIRSTSFQREAHMPPPVLPGHQHSFFSDLDKDNDGKVSRQEFPGPEEVFRRLDKNHNGYIDAEEGPPDSVSH